MDPEKKIAYMMARPEGNEALCRICDNHIGGKCEICSDADRDAYVSQGECGFAQVYGLRVSRLTFDLVTVGGREYGRDDPGLKAAVEAEKKRFRRK
jgi:hypothetical protein